ncbi:hypothetical protein [Nocardia terpenica]|uniref:Uncharacterized protein n=1 Tax=Nocardia terpenica TaxID=455432 RepID=A0A6G9Z4E8_9NOCA|nr:hypothetical protein [Nocardia terpenica]QIS20352.1 hypothetical protein F6W96_20695 [Nocardia terpenica]
MLIHPFAWNLVCDNDYRPIEGMGSAPAVDEVEQSAAHDEHTHPVEVLSQVPVVDLGEPERNLRVGAGVFSFAR